MLNRRLNTAVDMKLEHWRNYHKGQTALRIYANQPAHPLWPLCWRPREGPSRSLLSLWNFNVREGSFPSLSAILHPSYKSVPDFPSTAQTLLLPTEPWPGQHRNRIFIGAIIYTSPRFDLCPNLFECYPPVLLPNFSRKSPMSNFQF